MFDEIVAFAELDKFIDMQVRHYSSGMYVRLGFAVAVNVDPEILLVDEVLAVGDEQFARKCLDRVARCSAKGRTILFVTHGADLVRRICDRAIVLDHGLMIANTTSAEAVRTFRETLFHGGLAAQPHDPNSPDATPAMTHGELMASNATGRVHDHRSRDRASRQARRAHVAAARRSLDDPRRVHAPVRSPTTCSSASRSTTRTATSCSAPTRESSVSTSRSRTATAR